MVSGLKVRALSGLSLRRVELVGGSVAEQVPSADTVAFFSRQRRS